MADAADELECFPFLGKPVPQGMIDNVLSVCPDVDPKDVAKDLVITGSPMRTINRILDGQVSMVNKRKCQKGVCLLIVANYALGEVKSLSIVCLTNQTYNIPLTNNSFT